MMTPYLHPAINSVIPEEISAPEVEHYVRISEHHEREAVDYGIHYAYCTCGWEAEGDMVQLDRAIDQHIIDS